MVTKQELFLAEISDEALQQRIYASQSATELFSSLGFRNRYGPLLRKRIRESGLETSHWPGRNFGDRSRKWASLALSRAKELARLRFEEKTLPLLFKENCVFPAKRARSFIHTWNKVYGWLEYKCTECGNTGEWLGKKLSLQIDHINGDSRDNRLVNLRFLCPNCHAQTETFTGKNVKRVGDSESEIER